MKYGEAVIRLIGCNLEHDGGPDEEGRPGERWRIMHEEILAPRRPDAVFRQEATYSDQDGNRRLHLAEKALGTGMGGFLGPPGAGRNPTALFVHGLTFQVMEEHRHERAGWRTPPTNVVAELRSVPGQPIVMVSWHGAFNSPTARRREAEELAALADQVKHGASFIGFGDCNEYPTRVTGIEETVPLPDWTTIADRPHIMHRTTPAPDGSRVSCTYVDETLLGCGLHDPARYAAQHRGQKEALDPTAGHAATGQGGGRRIDRAYLDGRLVKAVLAVNVIDTSGASDHHALEVVLSRRGMEEALRGNVDPLPPLELTA